MMRRNFKTSMSVIGLAAALAGVVALVVEASPPQSASGEFAVESIVPLSVEPKGNVCLLELSAVFSFTGKLDGSFEAEFLIVHLGPCGPPAPEIFFAQGTFTGEVDGKEGSFDFTFQGQIDEAGQAEGDLVINRGTGDLNELSGQITLTGTTNVGGTYGGRIHFAP